MKSPWIVSGYGFFSLLAGFAIGVAVQAERSERIYAQELQRLQAPLLADQPPLRFLPSDLDGECVCLITKSTDWLLISRETGEESGGLDGTKKVQPVVSLVRSNMDGVEYLLRLNFKKDKAIDIPK
jgi:hypothetical protein